VRKDTRASSYQRQLQMKASEVTLMVLKLRVLPFETAIERYWPRESSKQEALVKLHLARRERTASGRHHQSPMGTRRYMNMNRLTQASEAA
jgi:hypothetical protein